MRYRLCRYHVYSDISYFVFFFSSRRRHTRFDCDWSSDVCSSDLSNQITDLLRQRHRIRADADADFFIFTQQEIANSAEATSKVMTLLLASIAAVDRKSVV